ncbi:MAG: cyclase family protein [Clostridia bacterium]|nr:cyclase family protein [Clostridia bacterium]
MEIRELERALGAFEMVDLSHSLYTGMPKWPAHESFSQRRTAFYEKGSYHNMLSVHEHSGTHIDAPAHFVRDGVWHKYLDELPLSSFFGRSVTIAMPGAPKCYGVTAEDIGKWEAEHILIEAGDVVLFDFGLTGAWEARDTERIVNDWPGLTGDAARCLCDKGVKIVGTDAISIDICSAGGNPAHHALLGSGIPILENIANLDKMPAEGYFMCLPLKIENGSGSPVRAVGLRPR